jgi:chromate transporter
MKHSLKEIFTTAWKLGWTSFGGPTAHIGYFQREYVEKKKWVDASQFAELVALCQLLPGPTSSQVGMGIGYLRGGILGAYLSWLGFTLPSTMIMIAFAFFTQEFTKPIWLHGLLLLAGAIITQAVYTMGTQMVTTPTQATIFAMATSILLLWNHPLAPLVVILFAGLFGCFYFRPQQKNKKTVLRNYHRSVFLLVIFLALFLFLPLLTDLFPSLWLKMFDLFYRSGSLVFGGGHVVLPLLEHELVQQKLILPEQFFAGYGAAQALPGPLFTFSAYVGTLLGGIPGGILATIAIFLPSFLLLPAILPIWEHVRQHPIIQAAIQAIHPAVVGILFATLLQLLQKEAIHHTYDFIHLLIVFTLIHFWRLAFLKAPNCRERICFWSFRKNDKQQ